MEKLLRYNLVNFELKATNTNEVIYQIFYMLFIHFLLLYIIKNQTKRILSAGTASQQNSNLIMAWEGRTLNEQYFFENKKKWIFLIFHYL